MESIWSLEPKLLNHPDGCTQGHAEFDADRFIRLSIPLGQLLGEDGELSTSFSLDGDFGADAVFGLSQDGYYQTLIDVHGLKLGFSAPGFCAQSLCGTQLYVSRKIIEPNPRIARFVLEMAGLREWVGQSPFIECFTPKEGGGFWKRYSLSYSDEDVPEVILLDSSGIKITLEHRWTVKGGALPTARFIHSCESDYDLVLSFNSPISLDKAFFEWAMPIRSFLCFCMGMRSIVRNMHFTTSEGVTADYYVPLVDGEEPSDDELRQMPISWSNYSGKIPRMLEQWLALEDQAKEAAKRAVSLLERKNVSIDTFFLANAQAFEAITRVGVEQKELSQEEYNRRIACVEHSGLEPKIIKWIKRKMKHANSISANELAEQRIKMLGEYGKYVVPDTESYLQEHRDTRNYYTHLDANGKSHILSEGIDAIINADATYMLLYGSVCQLLGFEPDELLAAVKFSRFKWSSVDRSRKRYRLEKSES